MNQLHEPEVLSTTEQAEQPVVVPTPEPVVQNAVTVAPVTPTQFWKQKKIIIAISVIAVIVIATLAYYFLPVFSNNSVVAVVNGEKIRQSELDESIQIITQAATMQGADPNDLVVQGQIRTMALDTLINNSLLLNAASAKGIVAEDAQIDEQIESLKTQMGGEEELTKRMEEMGLTLEKLRSNITDRIIVDAYIAQATDIETATVTPEEAQTYYDTMQANGTEMPPLDDIRAQIEGMLLQEKQQTIVNDHITELRDNAEVTITGMKQEESVISEETPAPLAE